MLALGLGLLRGMLITGFIAGAPPTSPFDVRLQTALAALQTSREPLIRELYTAAAGSAAAIEIRPITDDRSTWYRNSDRNRAHTKPADGLRKSEGRTKPADAVVYLPPDTVEPGSTHWRDGVLVHELVHALDLTSGRYNRDSTVRERRAVLMQNVWRANLGYKPRASYHGEFATLDYQEAVRVGALHELARYIFTRSDLPPPH